MLSLSLLLPLLALHLPVPGNSLATGNGTEPLAPFLYNELPLGSIKAGGWMQNQMEIQGAGLAGNLMEFYSYVNDSSWIGGSSEYSSLNEAAPYWYNGIVPLAYSLGDPRLINQANYFLNYVIDHQWDDGWLGPESIPNRDLWGRFYLLHGMRNHAAADPSQEQKIVTAIHKFVVIANSMLNDNYAGLINAPGDGYLFGLARAHEFVLSLQWLYEFHPDGQEALIWETMELTWAATVVGARDWTTFFVDGAFPTVGTPEINPIGGGFEHGVNLAEGLRSPAELYRMTKNESLIQMSRDAVNLTWTYQGTDSGTITADEYIGGVNPARGSELCTTVETIFSLSYLYRLIGDNSFADGAELAAFNALPATLLPDMWSRQYVNQVNQPWSYTLDADPFYNVNTYGNVYGLEPDYPCCTVNHGQGFPKFLMSSFATYSDSGLVHVYLIPATASTTIHGGPVSVTSNTNYPFSNTIDYTISAAVPFDFHVRIPDWAKSGSTVTFFGHTESITPDGNSLYTFKAPPGQSAFSITLGASIRVIPKANNAVAIYHGALLYALSINYTTVAYPPLDTGGNDPLPANTITSQTKDHTLTPTSLWSVAIDPSQIRFFAAPNVNAPLANPVYAPGAPPVEIWVAANNITWNTVDGTASPPPDPVELIGEPFWAKLVPYGSAQLHMGELPSVSLPKIAV